MKISRGLTRLVIDCYFFVIKIDITKRNNQANRSEFLFYKNYVKSQSFDVSKYFMKIYFSLFNKRLLICERLIVFSWDYIIDTDIKYPCCFECDLKGINLGYRKDNKKLPVLLDYADIKTNSPFKFTNSSTRKLNPLGLGSSHKEEEY